jgi:histidine triad (HIT) family protein
VRELERLTEGLLLVSETDAPLTVISWTRPQGRPTARRLASLLGEPHPELVEQLTLDRFFRAALQSWPGQTAEDHLIATRYATLVRFLKGRLHDVQVFRFGRVAIRSYVIGVAPNGDWLGLATNQTET